MLLHGVGLDLLVGAWMSQGAVILGVVGLLLIFSALMFTNMTVRDDGEFLAIRYGLLPVFRHRIRFADISSVEPGRTSIIDGWGIHWLPARGWTYNLWGFQCVKLTVAGRIVRVGSDDVDNLVEFLSDKVV